jgi:hypothetical protein
METQVQLRRYGNILTVEHRHYVVNADQTKPVWTIAPCHHFDLVDCCEITPRPAVTVSFHIPLFVLEHGTPATSELFCALTRRRVQDGTPIAIEIRRRNLRMKARSLVLVFIIIIGFGALGLAQDVASDVGKGAKDAGKATDTAAKDVVRGTKSATKAVVHGTDKAATDALKDTKSASKQTASASQKEGRKTGKEIGKGTEDAARDTKKAATKTADAVK